MVFFSSVYSIGLSFDLFLGRHGDMCFSFIFVLRGWNLVGVWGNAVCGVSRFSECLFLFVFSPSACIEAYCFFCPAGLIVVIIRLRYR